jgi:hypothetical protein
MANRRAAHRLQIYSRGHKHIVVFIGHSLGANATFDVANALDRQNIPVELIVTFDATNPQPVPKNVLHFVIFYQENGFGKRVSPGPGFQGELTNIDLTRDMGLSHTTIDKSPRLHAIDMQKRRIWQTGSPPANRNPLRARASVRQAAAS